MFVNSIFILALAAVAESRSIIARQDCTCTGEGQSCEIADISGSTGCPYTNGSTLYGGTEAGAECIAAYNPNFVLGSVTIVPEKRKRQPTVEKKKRQLETYNDLLDGTCGKYLLIFARGTTEDGNIGETVGPALQEGLSASQSGWAFQGVNYNATVDGDDCLGLPGGAVATQYIEMAASQCPGTKIIVSGYSEGAMVAHNGVGYASDIAKAAVTGVVVFGDPFNGAPIKGYPTSQIKTYCIAGDDVCEGEFVINESHLSYTLLDTTEAVAYIESIV